MHCSKCEIEGGQVDHCGGPNAKLRCSGSDGLLRWFGGNIEVGLVASCGGADTILRWVRGIVAVE